MNFNSGAITFKKIIAMDRIIYSICEEDVQNESLFYLGRLLTQDELKVFEDMLSDAIGETISPIYHTIFQEIQNG